MNNGTLYIIATPIGNLDDMSKRAIETLKSVDLILAEDTRHTKKLLSAFKIHKPIKSFHAHSSDKVVDSILALLEGKKVALVTDAGTPGIADPGGVLIEAVVTHKIDVDIVPIPGPSAISAALSIAGFRANNFFFKGYVPHKKGRAKYFKEIEQSAETVVCFETPHRIQKTLDAFSEFADKSRKIVIGRELTKLHETIYRTNCENIAHIVPEDEIRGEFVIVIEGKR